MGLFSGKRGVILGVANEQSLAAAIAHYLHQEGAAIGYGYLPDKAGRDWNLKRVKAVVDPLSPAFVHPCDVADDESLRRFFAEAGGEFGSIDFAVHSVAFAPLEDLKNPTVEVSRAGFHTAMDISAYSLIAVCREAAALMPQGGAVATLTYYGGEKVVGGYNLMGVCKAALEGALRYLAYDLAPKGVRVNAVSAGPVLTQSSAVFAGVMDFFAAMAPEGRNVKPEEVARAVGYLLSDLSHAVTGEVIHVDCGYHLMGSPGYAFERLGMTNRVKPGP